jgi:adenosylcobinamide-phosphate synthase
MGLLALIFSVVVDAIRPLRGRPQAAWPDEDASITALDDDAADPLAEVPYDPLRDSPAAAATSWGAEPGAPTLLYVPHPLERHALRLLDWVTSRQEPELEGELASGRPGDPASGLATGTAQWDGDRPGVAASLPGVVPRRVSLAGWLVVVAVPVVLVALAQALLSVIAGFFVFLLHVGILYLTVGLGAFYRIFSELQLLIGAGEERSARLVLARWVAAGSGGATAAPRAGVSSDGPLGPSEAGAAAAAAGAGVGAAGMAAPARARDTAMPLAGLATAQAVLAAYRDVFAPLFWYAVLPGAVGPVLYLFARFAACHSFPAARSAYQWLDWIPLRLASLGFALVGQFEDTVFCLRSVSPVRAGAAATADPYLHQRLLLLPVTGGALGFRLTDAGVDAQLRVQAPDLDLPGVEREASSLRPVSGLLLRSAVVWVGIYLLMILLS